MIDLTAAFKDALRREREWGYEQAKDLADRLGEIAEVRVNGGPNENWILVQDGYDVSALVYQPAPLVIAKDDLVQEARDLLDDVTVVTGLTAFDKVAFRMNRTEAEGVLPYPSEELKLEWDGFSVWDFMFETV
jgi:hypothetical protein